MRLRTAQALAAAFVLTAAALPAAADAKGITTLDVCGRNGCHQVDRAAVRAGFEAFRPALPPRRAEPFFTLRAKARVASGTVVEVASVVWLPRAGLTRPDGERAWTRPAPLLAAALRRAARGLAARPAAVLGSVSDAPPEARVVEVYAPARTATRTESSGPAWPAGAVAAAALLAGAGVAVRRRTRR
jgi:hypothetical protein